VIVFQDFWHNISSSSLMVSPARA